MCDNQLQNYKYDRVTTFSPCMHMQVFCQLIKQTAGINEDEIDTPGVLSCWQTMACMCCTFIPERAIKRYLVMHIKK